MPLYFFNYRSPEELTRDDVGCWFESLEHAYADAYCSAVDMGAEMLKAQRNPASHRIDIADADGFVLMELRFDEIFRSPRIRPMAGAMALALQEKLRVAQALRRDMNDLCNLTRKNVANAHEVLRRAREIV